MKAIQINNAGGPEVMQFVDLPVPTPKPSEVVVKLKSAGVNFIDIYYREGRYKAEFPLVPGQEGAGIVTSVGQDVKEIRAGDRVVWSGTMGSYAGYAAVPAEKAVPIPPELSEETATASLLQGMTAHYLTRDTYKLTKGETVLVHAAAGGVGLLLVQMAHQIGARVIGTVSTREKAALVHEAGADEVILYSEADFETEVKRLTANRGVDVVYDSVGKATFEKGLNILRPRGMMVLYGGSSGPVPPFDPMVLSQKGSLFLTRPSIGHYTASRTELLERSHAVFTMISSGRLHVRIGHTYSLAEAAQAHRDLEGRRSTGKLILIP